MGLSIVYLYHEILFWWRNKDLDAVSASPRANLHPVIGKVWRQSRASRGDGGGPGGLLVRKPPALKASELLQTVLGLIINLENQEEP